MKGLFERIHPRIYILLSGILMGFSIIFAEIGLLSYVALVPLALVMHKRICSEGYRAKAAYLDGFIFYMAFDIVAFHWFTYFYPLDFAGIDNGVAIAIIAIAWIGLSALQSIFSAFVFVIASRVSKTVLCKKYPILISFVFAALFAVNEWTQTFTWAGVPWARIAISQTEMPILMQNASLFGSYFLTFIVVLINFALALILIYPDKKRKYAIITCSIFMINVLVGTALFFIPTVEKDRSVKVASVQGDFPSQALEDSSDEIFSVYRDLSKKAVEEGAELIIWPEGVFATDIHDITRVNNKIYSRISVAVSELAKELDATIVVGSYVDSPDKTNTSVSVFYSDSTSNINAYAKRRPVPFGEFLPLASLVYTVAPFLAEINIFSTVSPGEVSSCFYAKNDEDSIKVGSLICFDSIYETLGIDCVREGAEMLIVPSNDSWFYDSRALNMHHSQNILRAVEQGRYTVSCGNTGITSIVNDKGELIKNMPIYTRGYVIDTVYASSNRTLYSYIGNLFVYLCIAFVVTILCIDVYEKRKIKKGIQ